MMIKKNALFIVPLVIIDQTVKLIISDLYMDMSYVLLPNVLLFRPVQNKHLSYFGSLFNTKIPLAVMILLEAIGVVVIIMTYRYCLSLYGKHHRLLRAFLCFGLAGILCGFIDNVFWGGSIDFIRLLDWFTFDLKDVYLSTMLVLIILFGFYYTPEYNKLSSREAKKNVGLISWIKRGCPNEPFI